MRTERGKERLRMRSKKQSYLSFTLTGLPARAAGISSQRQRRRHPALKREGEWPGSMSKGLGFACEAVSV